MRWTDLGLAALLAAVGCGGDDDGGNGSGGASNAGGGSGSGGVSSGGASATGGAPAVGGAPASGGSTGVGGTGAGGSATGGGAGSGNEAGASGAGSAISCTLDSHCTLVDNCCECSALSTGTAVEVCDQQCVVNQCQLSGVLGARCLGRRCVTLYDCDQSKVVCDAPLPSCADDELPSVRNGCYGECVARERCALPTDRADPGGRSSARESGG